MASAVSPMLGKMQSGKPEAEVRGLPPAHEIETRVNTVSRPSAANDAETALIEAICAGKSNLFYQLIQPYERTIYFAAYSILRNEADSEDVAQEAVLKALKNLKSFRKEAKFSTWLVQITINEARMKLRKDRRSKYDSLDEGQDNEEGDYIPKDFADWREIPSEALQRKELKDALKRALDSLSPIYR